MKDRSEEINKRLFDDVIRMLADMSIKANFDEIKSLGFYAWDESKFEQFDLKDYESIDIVFSKCVVSNDCFEVLKVINDHHNILAYVYRPYDVWISDSVLSIVDLSG